MTRDEHRAACIEAIALALARNMLPEHNLQTLDALEPRLKQCYLSAGKDGFAALHGIARSVSTEATERLILASKTALFELRSLNRAYKAFHNMPQTTKLDCDSTISELRDALVGVGDLTNPRETKP